jgi:DNA-binding XRE family transcriptional regulator
MQRPLPPSAEPDLGKPFQPASRQLLRALEIMAGMGFCTLSFATGKVQASEGLHVLAGTLDMVGQAVGFDFLEARTHPDDRAGLLESFHLLMRDMLPTARGVRLLRADGTVRQLEMRYERLVDDHLKAVGWIICLIDRTEEESLRRNLNLTRQRLRTVLDQLDVDLAWFSSLDGRLVERVKQSETADLPMTPIFAFESWLEAIHPEDRPGVIANLDRCLPSVTEVRVETSAGEYVPMRSVRQPVLGDTGETVEWLGLSSLLQPGHGGLEPSAAASEELLNGPLLRAARNLLGWTIPVLAEQSGVSASTIMRIEEATAPVTEVARRRTAERLTQALTHGGVIFHRTLTGKLAISL